MVVSLCSVPAALPFMALPGNGNPCYITELECALHQIYYEDYLKTIIRGECNAPQTGRSELLHPHYTNSIGTILISSNFLCAIQYTGFNL